MSTVWHIVKKDLVRLRVPIALWIALLVAEITLIIFVGGAFAPPDLGWLGRLGGGAEMFVRMFVPSIVAYLLVGWLVYGDSLVEPDPFWITRPISGGELFAAKLLGGTLIFVLLPILIDLPWWLACGFGWNEIALSAGVTAAAFALPVVVGLGVASATDSFQRYILWSFVGLAMYGVLSSAIGSFAAVVMAPRFLPRGGSTFGAYVFGGALLALAVAGHQFLTRRLARSIGLAVAGTVAISVILAAWVAMRPLPPSMPTSPDLEKVQLAVVGPGRVGRGLGTAKTVNLRLRADDLPKDAAVWHLRVEAEWRDGDKVVWATRGARGSSDMLQAAARDLLGIPAKRGAESDRTVPTSFPVAATSLQQITERSPTFRGVADLTILRGRILAEIPLRESSQRVAGRSFSISNLAIKPLNETALKRSARLGETNDGNAIALFLTERLAEDQGLGLEFWRWHWPPTIYAIVRHSTGEIIFSDPVATGPTGLSQFNRVMVFSIAAQFVPPSTAGWLDDATLAVIRFENPQTLQRIVTANPLALEMGEPTTRTSP